MRFNWRRSASRAAACSGSSARTTPRCWSRSSTAARSTIATGSTSPPAPTWASTCRCSTPISSPRRSTPTPTSRRRSRSRTPAPWRAVRSASEIPIAPRARSAAGKPVATSARSRTRTGAARCFHRVLLLSGGPRLPPGETGLCLDGRGVLGRGRRALPLGIESRPNLGEGALMATPVSTLTELFLKAASYNKPDCLLSKVGGTYQPISTAELVDRVRRLSKALRDLGVEKGDRVALMSENGPHWPTIDFATLCAGAVLVPIYPTLLPDQSTYIARNCRARAVVAETTAHLNGLFSEELPDVKQFVLIKGESSDPRVISLDKLIERGAGVDVADFEARARSIQPDDLATFIYTSGTTGTPKGVMLTHRNVASNVSSGLSVLHIERKYMALSFLPLSHSFERTVDYCYFLEGCSIAYAESVAAVATNMVEVKPHVFVSVPRVYEKVYSRVQEGVAAGSPIKQKLFAWAVGLGRLALPYRLKHQSPPGFLGLQLALAGKLVFSKSKARLRAPSELAISGGAPLGRDIAEFFWGAGIPIYEGYGLPETAPVIPGNTRENG